MSTKWMCAPAPATCGKSGKQEWNKSKDCAKGWGGKHDDCNGWKKKSSHCW